MRNLIVRTISGAVFLGVMILSLLISPIIFCALFAAIIAIMMGEYLRITIGQGDIIFKAATIVTGVMLFLGLFFVAGYDLPARFLFVLSLPIALIFIAFLYNRKDGEYMKFPYLISSIIYIALPFSLLSFCAFNADGCFNGISILWFFVILWSNDVGAYLFGMALGQKYGHKLFPSISPKKSWVGYFGSVITTLLAGFLLHHFGAFTFGLYHSLIIALIINIFGTFGDLVESQLKRNFDVKDSGKIMPGHGGLLDRFDGALLAFPIVISYLKLFELI